MSDVMPKPGAPSPGNVVEKVEVKKASSKKIEVVATQKGWINNSLKKPGDRFQISSEKVFSASWMEKV